MNTKIASPVCRFFNVLFVSTLTFFFFFFFNDTATTEIYTLSLHDALPICAGGRDRDVRGSEDRAPGGRGSGVRRHRVLRSEEHTSELQSPCISYAVFCLKKKKHRTTSPRDAR